MARINKVERLAIEHTMDHMGRCIKPEAHLPLDTFLNLFFTAKQREQLEAVSSFTEVGEYRRLPKIKVSSSVPDELPMPDELPTPEYDVRHIPRMNILVNSYYEGLHPKSWEFHPNASLDDVEAFDKCVREITYQGRVASLWEDIKDFYTEQAVTHEEMRYLFPGTVSILRKAGLHGVASAVEQVRRRPNINLDKGMADIFRFMNQWFAAQIMLETFDVEYPPATGARKDDGTVTLYLSSPIYSKNGHVVLKA